MAGGPARNALKAVRGELESYDWDEIKKGYES
jgi:hypothetical protein